MSYLENILLIDIPDTVVDIWETSPMDILYTWYDRSIENCKMYILKT